MNAVGRLPVPLSAGQIALRRQCCLADVVTASHGAALLSNLYQNLRTIHMAGQDVTALIDQAVSGLRFFHRQRPVAGKNHCHSNRRIYAARTESERIQIA